MVELGFDHIELEVCSAFSLSRPVFLNVYQMPSEVELVEEMLSLHENLVLILHVDLLVSQAGLFYTFNIWV